MLCIYTENSLLALCFLSSRHIYLMGFPNWIFSELKRHWLCLPMKCFLFCQDGPTKLLKDRPSFSGKVWTRSLSFLAYWDIEIPYKWRWILRQLAPLHFSSLCTWNFGGYTRCEYKHRSEKQTLIPVYVSFIYLIWFSRAWISHFSQSFQFSHHLSFGRGRWFQL